MVAASLGIAWRNLGFDGRGVATRFEELVEQPLLRLTKRTLDVRAVVSSFWGGNAAKALARQYDRHLYGGASLQDLPSDNQGPRFVLLATNLSDGTLWRFSKPYMRDWRSEPVYEPSLPLAAAVAASSAFPPFLSPFVLQIEQRRVFLSDGGVYDNLGLEPVVKRCRTIFVSDGGGSFPVANRQARDWARGTLRVLRTVDVQVRRLRKRQVVGLLASGDRKGAYWSVGTPLVNYPVTAPTLHLSADISDRLAQIPTRLAAVGTELQQQLANWGYTAADAAVRSYYDSSIYVPSMQPY